MALSPCCTELDENGRELNAHGTAAFPVACYHDQLEIDPVPWHWHEELEVLVVTEIAGQCGFQDGSYFARSFRQVYGCGPTEYRRKARRAGAV